MQLSTSPSCWGQIRSHKLILVNGVLKTRTHTRHCGKSFRYINSLNGHYDPPEYLFIVLVLQSQEVKLPNITKLASNDSNPGSLPAEPTLTRKGHLRGLYANITSV